MASLAILRTLHTASVSAYKSISANGKTSLIGRLSHLARPFCSRSIRNDAISTTNACVDVMEGKTPRVIENAETKSTPTLSYGMNNNLGGMFTKLIQRNTMIPTKNFQLTEVRRMSTMNQLVRKGREAKHRTNCSRALGQSPQKKKYWKRVFTGSAKKTYSVSDLRMHVRSNGHKVYAYFPDSSVRYHRIRGAKNFICYGEREKRRYSSRDCTPEPVSVETRVRKSSSWPLPLTLNHRA